MKTLLGARFLIKENVLFSEDGKVSFNDAEKVSIELCRNGLDVLCLQDISANDLEHDNTILTIKKIAKETDFLLIMDEHIDRLEDVKKYLYAGAGAVSMREDHPVFEEAVKRFGTQSVWKNDLNTVDGDHIEYITGKILENMDLNIFDLKYKYKETGLDTNVWESKVSFKDFKTNADGLIPVIVQDWKTNEVLMLAYMNEESYDLTVRYGKMTYYSRSRQQLWVKGETSGHFQYVKSLHLDCDNDTILAKVHQIGAACHTGSYSCFFRELVSKNTGKTEDPYKVLEDVYAVIMDRKANPKEGSYTNYLFDKGIDKILKKVGEEATEIIIAAKNPEPEEIIYEISDFLYHVSVLMAEKGVTWEDIMRELANR